MKTFRPSSYLWITDPGPILRQVEEDCLDCVMNESQVRGTCYLHLRLQAAPFAGPRLTLQRLMPADAAQLSAWPAVISVSPRGHSG